MWKIGGVWAGCGGHFRWVKWIVGVVREGNSDRRTGSVYRGTIRGIVMLQ